MNKKLIKNIEILIFALVLVFGFSVVSFAYQYQDFNDNPSDILNINKSSGYFVALRFFYDVYEETYIGQFSVLTEREFLNEFEWITFDNTSQLEFYINNVREMTLDGFVEPYAYAGEVSNEIATQSDYYVNNTRLTKFVDYNGLNWFIGFVSADSYTLASVVPDLPYDESPITTMFQEVKHVFMPLTEYVDEQVVDIMLYLLFVSLVYFIVIRNLFRLFGSTKCIQVADTIFIALCIGAIISTLGINLIGVINNV